MNFIKLKKLRSKMDKEKLIGRFYFKCTNNGNLIGEFSNNISSGIYSESADLNVTDKKGEDPFIGNYISTWRENGRPKSANLLIEYKLDTNSQIYSLTWKLKGNINYFGEGMLCDNILIGDYRQE